MTKYIYIYIYFEDLVVIVLFWFVVAEEHSSSYEGAIAKSTTMIDTP